MLVCCLADFDKRHGNAAAHKKHSGYNKHICLNPADKLEHCSAQSGSYYLRKADCAVKEPEITAHMLS